MVRAAAEMWYSAPTEKSAEEFSFAADLHRLLACLRHAPSDDVINRGRINPAAVNNRVQ